METFADVMSRLKPTGAVPNLVPLSCEISIKLSIFTLHLVKSASFVGFDYPLCRGHMRLLEEGRNVILGSEHWMFLTSAKLKRQLNKLLLKFNQPVSCAIMLTKYKFCIYCRKETYCPVDEPIL